MDYKELYDKSLALEREKIEQVKTVANKRRYINLFNLSINIISNLNHVRKIIKKIKKT